MFLSDDDMVECPYNKTHRMLRKRLQSHLLKCRVHYPDVELRKCPFNITHLIPEPEFAHHATNCPDRKLITQYKYDAPEQKEEEKPKHEPVECDENWDDTDVNDYNPRLYLDKANIIRQPDGASRSERKLFIKKERIRLGDGGDSCDEENETSVSSPGNKRQRDNTYDVEDHDRPEDPRCSRSRSPTSYGKERTRSPANKIKRDRSRSPIGLKRSYSDHSSPRRGSVDYPQKNKFNSFQDSNCTVDGRNTTYNQYNNDRDTYYSSNTQVYYNRNSDTDPTMPPAPPPPMISYPSPRSYFSTKPSSGQ